jgi:PAS domain S-box-containing protein
MALVAVVILVGGYLFYRDQEQQMRQRIEGGLTIVAQLKVDQITEWRAERLTDADMLVGSPFFAEGVEKYLASPTDTEIKDKILARLAVIAKSYPYQDILLTDVNGSVLLRLNDSVHRLSDMTLAQLAVAIKAHKAVITDFHYPPDSDSPHLDVVAPLFPWRQDSPQAIGAVVFCIDPSQYLYPLLQSSPIPSETAETLLVERDGDQVLYLNELRYQKDTALKLRIPLSQQENPVVMAVLGKEGVVKGKDYRGVEVLAVLKHIPDSPWYMVAKIDTSEALWAWSFRAGIIIASVVGLLAAALAGIGLIWQRRQRLAYQALYQAELETQALRSHFEYLVKYANDIIILTDENYHIVEVNDRALETYGYTRQEMLGLPLAALVAPEDRPSYQSRLRKIQQKGKIVAEGIHQRKDGSTFPVEVSGRTIKIEDKSYFQEIVRDITEHKEAEGFLLLSEQNFRDSIENSPLGIRIANEDGKTLYTNRALLDIYGYSSIEELEAVPRKQRYIPGSYDEHRERTKKRRQGEFVPTNYEISIVRKDGDVRHLAASRGEVLWDDEKQFQVVYQDITERKRTQDALQESEKKYRTLTEQSLQGLVVVQDFRCVFANTAFVKIFGYSVEELLSLPPAKVQAIVHPEDQALVWGHFRDRLAGKTVPSQYEYRGIRKDGTICWLEMFASQIEYGGKPAIQGAFVDRAQAGGGDANSE